MGEGLAIFLAIAGLALALFGVLAWVKARTELAVAREKLAASERRMQDWEAQRLEFERMAKASVLGVGQELSNKLLADHKREQEEAKKQQEQITKQTTAKMFEQFEAVSKAVASLGDRVKKSESGFETVMRALSSPGGAGSLAEVGLENMLRQHDLQEGRDFLLQASVEGMDGRLRPDALVFPNAETTIVIDCKASKFLIDLAEAHGTEREASVLAQLRQTMQNHLRGLASRDYGASVAAHLRKTGRPTQGDRVLTVMYLPSEAAHQRLMQVAPDFGDACMKHDIILADPRTLLAIIKLARIEIDRAQQIENHQKILLMVQGLLDGVRIMLDHAGKVGKSLQGAADHFDAFAKSINKFLLPRGRNIVKLGLRLPNNKELPANIPSFHVHIAEDAPIIDVEDSAPQSLTVRDKISDAADA
ncbi:MAG: DNA recombination protein RmuC [Alphaproteobacteria bacterium]|nr:DNA recombination protein RmuC [Alphaproteobacteria bacterium]